MKIRLLIIALVGLLATSCSSIKTTSSVVPVNNTICNMTVADIDISTEKVSKEYNWTYNPFNKVPIATAKTNTTAALLKECDADVLIEPQYIVEKRGFLRGYTLTVTGFPAKYKGFHKMTAEEAVAIKEAANLKQQGTIAKTKRTKSENETSKAFLFSLRRILFGFESD